MRFENGLEKLRAMPGKSPHFEGQVGNESRYNPNKIELLTQHERDVTIVILKTDSITSANAASFKTQLLPFITPEARIVLDMEAVRFLDSAGIGVLMSCIKNLRSMNGSLKICRVTSQVTALFELVRLDRLLDIHITREEAVKSFP